MKICPSGAELSHADGRANGQADCQKDVMKPIVSLRNFASAPKKYRLVIQLKNI